MPPGCVVGDKLQVLTERGDLGYGRGKSGSWWALIAFGALCDEQVELPYPYTLWVFPPEVRLAVERLLRKRGRELAMVSHPELEAELSRIVSKDGEQTRP